MGIWAKAILLAGAGAGLYVSAYFLMVYYKVMQTEAALVPRFCRLEEGACSLVVYHPDGRLLGVPNAALAIPYYAAVIAAIFLGRPFDRIIMFVSWGTVAMSAYLVYSLAAKVKVWCPLCLAAHILNAVIAAALTFAS